MCIAEKCVLVGYKKKKKKKKKTDQLKRAYRHTNGLENMEQIRPAAVFPFYAAQLHHNIAAR